MANYLAAWSEAEGTRQVKAKTEQHPDLRVGMAGSVLIASKHAD